MKNQINGTDLLDFREEIEIIYEERQEWEFPPWKGQS